MKPRYRLILAFVLSPLLGAIPLALLGPLSTGTNGGIESFSKGLLVVASFNYIGTALLGGWVLHLLVENKATAPWQYIVAGGVVGAVCLFFIPPIAAFSAMSGAATGGVFWMLGVRERPAPNAFPKQSTGTFFRLSNAFRCGRCNAEILATSDTCPSCGLVFGERTDAV